MATTLSPQTPSFYRFFREKLHYLIEHEIFNIRLIGRLLELADQIPVVKGRCLAALLSATKKLEVGHSVVIFPEARLNNVKQLFRAHLGAALLAVETGVPVVPISFYTPPKYLRVFPLRLDNRPAMGAWQLGTPLLINIGQPLRAMQNSNEYIALRHFTEQVMGSIVDLINKLKPGESPLAENG